MNNTSTFTPSIYDPATRPWMLDTIFNLIMQYLRVHGEENNVIISQRFIFDMISEMSNHSFYSFNAKLNRCIGEQCREYKMYRNQEVVVADHHGFKEELELERDHDTRRSHARVIINKIEELYPIMDA